MNVHTSCVPNIDSSQQLQNIYSWWIFEVMYNLQILQGQSEHKYKGWNFNSGNYLFTTDTK